MNLITTYTLQNSSYGKSVARILSAALNVVEPGQALANFMQRHDKVLEIAGQAYHLEDYRRVLLVGCGKAGAPMAQKAAQILGEHLTAGVMVVKEGYAAVQGAPLPERLHILEAGHPLPDERSLAGARRIGELLADTTPDDLVIGLISGGGSALLVSPAPGVSLANLQALTSTLLACGATINEINTLRKHLDQIKGGGLARLAAPSRLVTLILSDVVGDPLEIIASGPTAPDNGTFSEALQILERYKITTQVPPAILEHLQRGAGGEIPDTPKPGDPLFEKVSNLLIGSNRQAAQAALEQAQAEGFHTLLLTTYLQGEARQAGKFLAAIARQLAEDGQPLPRPACLVAGGETTVTLRGDGLGGRNQEVALAAVEGLAGLAGLTLVTLATDGGDGPTDAAGAVVSGETLGRALNAGLGPDAFLARNDAYHFFDPLGDLIRTGPTQTNVNDLNFIFAF